MSSVQQKLRGLYFRTKAKTNENIEIWSNSFFNPSGTIWVVFFRIAQYTSCIQTMAILKCIMCYKLFSLLMKILLMKNNSFKWIAWLRFFTSSQWLILTSLPSSTGDKKGWDINSHFSWLKKWFQNRILKRVCHQNMLQPKFYSHF